MRITVGQYQELYSISKSEDSDIEKAIQSVCVVTGKTAMEVEDMPIGEFKQLSQSVIYEFHKASLNAHPKSFLKARGKLFQVNYIPSTLRSAQYTELQAWLGGDLIENLHLILASIVFPVKKYLWVKLPGKNDSSKHKEVAELIKEMDFYEAYGCVIFFCKLFNASIKGTLNYLESSKQMTKEYKKLKQDLMNVLDGSLTQSGWLSSVE